MAAMMFLVGTFAANAQPGRGMGPGNFDPEQMAQMRANQMKEAVNLTDAQYTKVVELFKAENAEMQKAFQSGQQGGGREAFEKMRTERETKLKAILTEEQFKTWTEKEREFMRGPGGPGGPGPGGPGPGPRQ